MNRLRLPPDPIVAKLPPAKLGEQIAARLEAQIKANAWPAGHFLGHEQQLAQDFGISRSALREAIAIAEWNGAVESRRGREGGLYVCQQALEPAGAVLRNYLYLTGAGLAELLGARRLIEGAILELAVERIDRDQARRLEQLLAGRAAEPDDRVHLSGLKQMVDAMADLAGSPLLRLMGGSLRHCYVDRVRTTTLDDGAYLRASRAVAALRLQQIEAIVAYDRGAARDLQTRALDVWAQFGENVPTATLSGAAIISRLTATGDAALIYEFVRPAKKAEAVARAIAQRIAGDGVGARIGTEPELIASLAVSRRVLREGIRILERFGIVTSGRGKNGGLLVGQPRPLALPGALLAHPEKAPPVPPGDSARVAALLAVAAAQAVTQEAGQGSPAARALADRLRGDDMPDQEGRDREAWTSFVAFLLESMGDPVTKCLLGVVAGLHSIGPAPSPDKPSLVRVLEAIGSGDRFGTPRLMQAALANVA